MIRIAIITDLPLWYTETHYLNEVEKRMQKTGIDCKVFVVRGSQFFEIISPSAGILFNLTKIFKKISHFDIIIGQFSFPIGFGLTFLSSLRLLNKPIIIHTHGYDVFTVPSIDYGLRRKRIGEILTNYAWKKADEIIVTCEKAKLEIKKTGIEAEKINVLYNGIDENLFKKSRSVIPNQLLKLREDNEFIFLSVAMTAPVKNHSRMIKAFENLAEKYDSKSKIKLVLIGAKHIPFESQNSNVIYLEKKNHSEINQYYNIADAFVLPSLSEGHPLSLLEAMSCELPVIASNVGGVPETLHDNRFLVNPVDTDDIMKKLEYVMLLDQAEREKIGLENRNTVLNHYTLDKHINNLKTIYTHLL